MARSSTWRRGSGTVRKRRVVVAAICASSRLAASAWRTAVRSPPSATARSRPWYWTEHAHAVLGGRLDEHARLSLAPSAEPVRGRASGTVPAVHVACADLRGHELLALEHAGCEAAKANEQDADEMILGGRRKQRLDVDDLPFALRRQAERRSDGHDLVRELEARLAPAVEGASGRTLERREPLADVLAHDEASFGHARLLSREPGGKISDLYSVQDS